MWVVEMERVVVLKVGGGRVFIGSFIAGDWLCRGELMGCTKVFVEIVRTYLLSLSFDAKLGDWA